MDTNKSSNTFKKLSNSIPSIGFLSRKKRVLAFIKVTAKAQEMIDAEEITEDEALMLLSLLVRKNKDFQKSGMMTALNLADISAGVMKPIGVKYANSLRAQLKMAPIEQKTALEL
ncbi:MAG: hypothetical protein V3V31_16520 [Methylococcales bacterium]